MSDLPLPTQGIIVQYHPEKGSGYLRAPLTREEFYFKTELMRGDLALGTKVHFQLEWDGKEYIARDIIGVSQE